MCGTSSIVNYSPEELPLGEADIDDPEIGERYPIRAPHHEILERRRAVGKPLAVLPFPGAVYVVETNDNWTASAGRVSRKRRLLRMAAPSKRLSPELRREFSMEWTTAADPQSSPTT